MRRLCSRSRIKLRTGISVARRLVRALKPDHELWHDLQKYAMRGEAYLPSCKSDMPLVYGPIGQNRWRGGRYCRVMPGVNVISTSWSTECLEVMCDSGKHHSIRVFPYSKHVGHSSTVVPVDIPLVQLYVRVTPSARRLADRLIRSSLETKRHRCPCLVACCAATAADAPGSFSKPVFALRHLLSQHSLRRQWLVLLANEWVSCYSGLLF